MSNAIKDAVLALFEPINDVVEPAIPVAPVVSVDVLVCPHCDCDNCEVWNSTEARMAECPECGAEFPTTIGESRSKITVKAIFERRGRLRRSLSNSLMRRTMAKNEISRLMAEV